MSDEPGYANQPEDLDAPADSLKERLRVFLADEHGEWDDNGEALLREALARIEALEAENKRLRELVSKVLDYDPHGQVMGEEWNRAALKEIME